MRDHRKLRAFELADELAVEVYRETREFPADERFGLRAQVRRGAVSVASNIVEACGRWSYGDNLRFLDIAFASAREVDYQLGLAKRLGYLPRGPSRSTDLSAETCRVLHGLIRSRRPAPE